MTLFSRWVAIAASVFFVVFGVWAFADAESFYDSIATFPPYNEHFLHDVGAFQIGLGGVLAFAVVGWPSLAATLGGVAAGSVFHAAAHFIDRDHGGRDSDPWALGLFAAVVLVAAVAARPRRSPRPSSIGEEAALR